MRLEKVRVRDKKLWNVGVIYLGISAAFFLVSVWDGNPYLPLVNIIIALGFLAIANRFRALRMECNGRTLLLIPDYATSTIILKDSRERVLAKDFFSLFEEKRLETPCGTLEIRVIRHRPGRVELRIKAEGEEITLS